jgi:primosomal protein N' (replication factor Y) (superfamily II helicase)
MAEGPRAARPFELRGDDDPELWAEIAVPLPLRWCLTYRVPAAERRRAQAGVRALVRVGPRSMTGIVVSVGPAGEEKPKGLRDLSKILDEEPLFSAELLSFLIRAADYYLCPPGEALRSALPPGMSTSERGGKMRAPVAEPPMVDCARLVIPAPGDPVGALTKTPARARLLSRLPEDGSEVPLAELRRFHRDATKLTRALVEEGWVELLRRPPPPDPLLAACSETPGPPLELTQEQRQALESIEYAVDAGEYRGLLLHGVTGSGKTEIYIRAIEGALARGKTALVLVPEIALTPQLVSRFRSRLGSLVGVLHSGLTQSQRLREWSRLNAGEARVAIGARSAIFAPLRELAIIVVDEEHDPSFKQDDGFRYNGRDLALLRAQRAGAIAILGSATPSLESMHNVELGKLELISMPFRVTPRPLPTVEIVDLRRHRSGPGKQLAVTGPLLFELKRCIEEDRQAILFLNRRGYAPVAVCQSCGDSLSCRACSVSMTYHRRTALLECHYCAHAQPLPETCPTCGATGSLELVGVGTEQAEEILATLLGPKARVGRLDSDIAPGRSSEAVIEKLRAGETNVLVGTQLVTKGHDLPRVSVVGVLLADATLHFPDFRATERTFQLLTQVAGRAGRGDIEGRVVVQTFLPDHPAIRFASNHNYEDFYHYEMASRVELGYPPVAHLAAIRLSAKQESALQQEADRIAAFAARLPEVRGGRVQILGPAPAPIAVIRERFRYRILLKAEKRSFLRSLLLQLIEPVDATKGGVRASFDVDPVHML